MRLSFTMDPNLRESVLMFVCGAMVYFNNDTPMFRELAYSRSPNSIIREGMETAETCRVATPYRFGDLDNDQKQAADEMRKQLGLKLQPSIRERSFCCE